MFFRVKTGYFQYIQQFFMPYFIIISIIFSNIDNIYSVQLVTINMYNIKYVNYHNQILNVNRMNNYIYQDIICPLPSQIYIEELNEHKIRGH